MYEQYGCPFLKILNLMIYSFYRNLKKNINANILHIRKMLICAIHIVSIGHFAYKFKCAIFLFIKTLNDI